MLINMRSIAQISRILLGLSLVCLFQSTIYSQMPTESAKLIARINSESGDIYESLSGPIAGVSALVKEGGNVAAVRICRTTSLQTSVATKPFALYFLNQLVQEGVPTKNLYLLSSDRLCSKERENILFEVWLIPSGTEFPQFDDLRVMSNLDFEPIFYLGVEYNDGEPSILQNERSFYNKVVTLKERLKAERSAMVTISTCAKKGTEALELKLSKIREILDDSDIDGSRVIWRVNLNQPCHDFPDIVLVNERR